MRDVDHSASLPAQRLLRKATVALRPLSRHAARIANKQRLAALWHRRASKWADAIREGLDPDIARFIRDQAAAWQLLATSYGRFAGHEEKSRGCHRENHRLPNDGELVRGELGG